jgi:glycosyltransferase involved in cell wall biosynthesis
MKRLSSLSVIVPVYNGALTVELLAQRLADILPSLVDCYELVLVNDGSHDQSWQVIEKLTATYPWVCGINLMRNYGQHNALLCGIRRAQHEVIVTMDDDMQNPPEEIAKLLECLGENNTDVVYGIPKHEQHGLWRDLASQITKLALQSAMGVANARNVSAFRAFHTQLRDAFSAYHGPYVSIDVLLTWSTTHFASVKVRHDPRTGGKSNYTFGKLITHALNMMTGFSVVPLQIASILGFAFVLFGIVVFLYVIGRYLLQGNAVSGFPFLASIIAIFSGVQLFTLGIIGEYLARMYSRIMNKPPYTVRVMHNLTKQSEDKT